MVSLTKAAIEKECRAFIEKWNYGEIDLSNYAEDASFIGSEGYIRGREVIAARYHAKYPNRETMGTLELEIVEFRCPRFDPDPKMATVVLRYAVRKGADVHVGYALETYELRTSPQGPRIYVTQDITV